MAQICRLTQRDGQEKGPTWQNRRNRARVKMAQRREMELQDYLEYQLATVVKVQWMTSKSESVEKVDERVDTGSSDHVEGRRR